MGGMGGDVSQATTDLLSWFNNPDAVGGMDQAYHAPPMGTVSAGISPFMPFSMQDGGSGMQGALPGLSDLGDQGWDQVCPRS